ncbi:MAG: single-stranded DNA-binding protein [Nocardioides sp.]|uniref:single-stranded DNA-binding protein n=1 Tax=Nocardioides sp. TaxID=35761 RepID=UPI002608089B|nr:single-stranded DNA-binding protein [Nocardioides sp.]
MLNETTVTVQGWIGGPVSLRRAGNAPVASFRLAATPRRYHPATGEWSDDTTQWFTVNAWRALGEHCAHSLRRSDPVVVVGRLRASTWVNAAGVEVTSFEIDAQSVGHDLNRGTSLFTRAQRAAQGSETARAEEQGPAGAVGADAAPGTGADSGDSRAA